MAEVAEPAPVLPWSPGKEPYWMKEGWVEEPRRGGEGDAKGLWYWEWAEEARRNAVHWRCGTAESGGRMVPVLEVMDPPRES